jgi:hypothetical protein
MSADTLEAGIEEYARPGYQAMDAYPGKIGLSKQYAATYEDVSHLLPPSITNPKNLAQKLPEAGEITGQQATHWYSVLMNKANQFAHMQGANAAGETYADISNAYRSLANTLYDSVNDAVTTAGRPELAENWRNAATYYAKNKAVLSALDGAGNVNVTGAFRQAFLKSMRGKGPPLSGNIAMLAEAAADNPSAFTLVRGAEAPSSMAARIGKATLPWLGTAAGAAVGRYLGTPATGAVSGRIAGEQAAQTLENR